MSASVLSNYPQSVLTLSAGTDNGTDNGGVPTDALLGRLNRRLRKAQRLGDRVAVILLQQRIRHELAR